MCYRCENRKYGNSNGCYKKSEVCGLMIACFKGFLLVFATTLAFAFVHATFAAFIIFLMHKICANAFAHAIMYINCCTHGAGEV